MVHQLLKATSIAAVVASMALVGCTKREQTDAKTLANDTVAQVNQSSKELAADASGSLDKAKVATRELTIDAKDKVSDAVISTSVKAELARDPDLSALRINVDTEGGHVALRGTAPSQSARDHATVLAQGVTGVAGVDNELTINPSSKNQ